MSDRVFLVKMCVVACGGKGVTIATVAIWFWEIGVSDTIGVRSYRLCWMRW